MINKVCKAVLVLLVFLPFYISAQQTVNIVPLPKELQVNDGSFAINENSSLLFNSGDKKVATSADFFVQHVQKISGIKLKKNSNIKFGNSISFNIRNISDLGSEGYTMSVTPRQIKIEANTSAGIFYALQSLIQTLPSIRTNEALQVPCMQVQDTPRFGWRGLMLDVSRHFFSTETVKEIIDLMAMFKMNVLHWHLCDDQGWRLEIKKYPKLTSVGAWRMEKEGALFYNKDTSSLAGKPEFKYGGYYTQQQVKEIIDYAAFRNITVVLEIEMPGHSGAALAAYPQYSCEGTPQPVPNIQMSGNFYSFHSNYCPGNPETFTFLENIITEVTQLFPSKYIHIGGDEVNKKDWKACAKCQSLMKRGHLKNEEELQSYFIRKMEKFIISKGKRMIGWGEILEGGLAPEATVMSWIGEKSGIEAAKMKHDVIMCPSNPLYLNRHQTDSIQYEPYAPKFSINTLEKVYAYNPLPEALSADEQKYILGAQAVIWTEFIRPVEHLEYMLLPRMCALAETVWTPKEKQNFQSFKQRMKPRLTGFEQNGIRFFNKDKW